MRKFDPSFGAADEASRREIAKILASGVLRLRKLRVIAAATAPHGQENPLELSAQRLEVSAETVLSVHSG